MNTTDNLKESFKERLKLLKEKRKQTSHQNFKEVLEENEKSKRPANYDKLSKRLQIEQEKLKSEDPEYKIKKSLEYQADQLEKWERLKGQKKNRQEPVPVSSKQDSVEGIERMVNDVNKQIEIKSKRSRRRRFDDEADVDYINERNMRFNKKLERAYGTYTEEIKQNFERGTAM